MGKRGQEEAELRLQQEARPPGPVEWPGHRPVNYLDDQGERRVVCRRYAASSAAGRLTTLRKRNGLLFGSCKGAQGPKEQIRRLGKGLHPLPSMKGVRCSLEEGLSVEAEKELQEAAGGEKPAAGKEAEARGQVRPEAWVQPLGAAAQADGVEAGELQAMGDKAVAVAASRAREAGEVRGAAMA